MEPVWGLCWAGNGGSPPPTAASESGAESTAAQVLRPSWDTLGAGVSIWRQWGSPDDLENANPTQVPTPCTEVSVLTHRTLTGSAAGRPWLPGSHARSPVSQ